MAENPLGDLAGIAVAEGLQRWGGSVKAYKKALLGFVQDHAQDSQPLQKAYLDGDISRAKALTHTLKGVAGNLALFGISQTTMQLETALQENQQEKVVALLETLQASILLVCTAIQTLEEAPEAPPPLKEQDRASLEPLLQELNELLQEEDMDGAEENLTRLRTILPKATEIQHKLDEYDFEGALETLQRIGQQLGIPIQ